MTLQSRKKHPTTLPNSREATSRNGLLGIVCCTAVLLVPSLQVRGATGLQWDRPAVAKRSAQPQQQHGHARLIRDSGVVTAAWEEESTPQVQSTAALERGAAPSTSAYDPFEADDAAADRLAQLPEDHFDDPFEEPTSPAEETADELNDDPTADTNIDAVENALEDELERRELRYDNSRSEAELEAEPEEAPEEDEEQLDESHGIGSDESDPFRENSDDPLERDPLRDLDDSDLFDEDEDKNTLDLKDEDFDLDLDYGDRSKDQEQEGDKGPTAEELEKQRQESAESRRESEENCRQELLQAEKDVISKIDLSIRVEGEAGEDFPHECAFGDGLPEPRQWPEITYNWKASALCHKPLYFEQVQLERYGHSWGPYVQPIMSGAHFFGSVPILPYKMGIRTPRECVYALGYYRPGSCAPYMIDPVPFTWRAALFQGGAVTGAALVIP